MNCVKLLWCQVPTLQSFSLCFLLLCYALKCRFILTLKMLQVWLLCPVCVRRWKRGEKLCLHLACWSMDTWLVAWRSLKKWACDNCQSCTRDLRQKILRQPPVQRSEWVPRVESQQKTRRTPPWTGGPCAEMSLRQMTLAWSHSGG